MDETLHDYNYLAACDVRSPMKGGSTKQPVQKMLAATVISLYLELQRQRYCTVNCEETIARDFTRLCGDHSEDL